MLFHFLEVESTKDAEGAGGKVVAVDRKKSGQNGNDSTPFGYWADQQVLSAGVTAP